MAYKSKEGSGGPSRVIAIFDSMLNSSSNMSSSSASSIVIFFITLTYFYLWYQIRTSVIVTDRTFGSAELFGWTVRLNFYCAVRPKWQNFFLQNTEPFFRITFNANGILSYFCFAKWPTCTWSLGKIAKRMPTEPKLEWNYHINLKLFVCLLDLGFTHN